MDNQVFHCRSKHNGVKYHYIRHQIHSGEVNVVVCLHFRPAHKNYHEAIVGTDLRTQPHQDRSTSKVLIKKRK